MQIWTGRQSVEVCEGVTCVSPGAIGASRMPSLGPALIPVRRNHDRRDLALALSSAHDPGCW